MASASQLSITALGIIGGLSASPPKILRENMMMHRDDRIGVPMLDETISHWWSWHQEDGRVPNWTRFNPFKHPKILPHIMVYEFANNRFRCSIVGETAGSHLPIKIARRFIDEVMPPENLQDISKRLISALETGTPNFVDKTMAWKEGYDFVSYSALQLPFSEDNGGVARILSVLDFRVEPTLCLGPE